MNIVLSTKNPSKAEQIKNLFKDIEVSILTLNEAGIAGEAIENGQTLEENARKKALYALEHMPSSLQAWSMADDTGLFIEALDGAPGIHAARWAGQEASTKDITNYTLNRLHGIINRKAEFKTVAILISPEGKEYIFQGSCSGVILEAEKVPTQPKMPYSGIFVPSGYNKVWAEMTTPEENKISHRGKAFYQLKTFITTILHNERT